MGRRAGMSVGVSGGLARIWRVGRWVNWVLVGWGSAACDSQLAGHAAPAGCGCAERAAMSDAARAERHRASCSWCEVRSKGGQDGTQIHTVKAETVAKRARNIARDVRESC
eukprot:7304542-Prymnesium_polylepis.1